MYFFKQKLGLPSNKFVIPFFSYAVPRVPEKVGLEIYRQIWCYIMKHFKQSSLVHITIAMIAILLTYQLKNKKKNNFLFITFQNMTFNVMLTAEPLFYAFVE